MSILQIHILKLALQIRNFWIHPGKVFRIIAVRYNWPMSAHASQAFSIVHCIDLEDLPSPDPPHIFYIRSTDHPSYLCQYLCWCIIFTSARLTPHFIDLPHRYASHACDSICTCRYTIFKSVQPPQVVPHIYRVNIKSTHVTVVDISAMHANRLGGKVTVYIVLFNSYVKYHGKTCTHCWNISNSHRGLLFMFTM